MQLKSRKWGFGTGRASFSLRSEPGVYIASTDFRQSVPAPGQAWERSPDLDFLQPTYFSPSAWSFSV
jgi:hypothetical protein